MRFNLEQLKELGYTVRIAYAEDGAPVALEIVGSDFERYKRLRDSMHEKLEREFPGIEHDILGTLVHKLIDQAYAQDLIATTMHPNHEIDHWKEL